MRTLGIFAKHPVAGTVKTRLAAETDASFATDLYTAFLSDLTARLRDLADERVIGFAPNADSAREYFTALADSQYQLWVQPDGGLGERISAFLDFAQRGVADRVVLIGSDSPTLPRSYLEKAFAALESNDVVIGPATDGGYYLIGLAKAPGAIFDEIEWSGSSVLNQTVTAIARQGDSLAVLDPWYDVDTLEDVHALWGHLQAWKLGGLEPCPQTFELLERHRDAAIIGK
ncbi:MAG: hypothetical protein CMJ78_23320 [Planctomycetaceae bacterium]|nr:hypothetical protein [Planctomycetaceae bacterium]